MLDQDLKLCNPKTVITRMEAAEYLLARCMQKMHDLTTWIPCSERMPATREPVQVCCLHEDGHRTICTMRWMSGFGCWDSWNGRSWILSIATPVIQVTHWRELPDLPPTGSGGVEAEE